MEMTKLDETEQSSPALREIGPYPHMWLSDDQSPYVEQIGLGLGALKVTGSRQTSLPIWPACLPLPKEKDPIRSSWQPHGMAPIEPKINCEKELDLVERKWRPHVLESEFLLRGKRIFQEIVVAPSGASCEMRFEEAISDFKLEGHSYGEADYCMLSDGLRVYERSQNGRPLYYVVKFEPAPDRIEIKNSKESEAPKAFSKRRQIFWKLIWKEAKSRLQISLQLYQGIPVQAIDFPNGKLNHEKLKYSKEKSWAKYFQKEAIRIETPDSRIGKIVDYLCWVYRSNGVKMGGLLNHRFNIPKQTFSGFWCWDSCFHALGGRWLHDRELVWGNLANMPNLQYPEDSHAPGCISNSANTHGVDVWLDRSPTADRIKVMPHMIKMLKGDLGDGSHPPMLAKALESVWETEGQKFLHPGLLECAMQYNDWWDRARASDRFPGLLLVRRWSDSGMDNSKRWGRFGSGIYGTTGDTLSNANWSMPIVTVDTNVYSVMEKRSIARMLKQGGETSLAMKYEREALERESLVLRHLWNQESQFFFDRTEDDGMFVPVLSPTGAHPLLLGAISQEQIDGVLRLLLDPDHFFTKAPFPSLSASDPDFRPEHSYWMGPTWMYYTAYILKGLFRHDKAKAWMVMENILDTLVQDGVPYIFENYNPLTRQYYDCQGFLCQTAFIDLILTEILGLTIRNNELLIDEPSTPISWKQFTIRNIYFKGLTYNISASRTEGENWKWKPECHSG